MDAALNATRPGLRRIFWVGILVGFLLNLTGWIGNNFVLGALWDDVGAGLATVPWRASIWRDVISFVPDYGYGLAIAWLVVAIRPRCASRAAASLRAGLFVALVGGIITYLAIANSGFIPWRLAFASFGLVLGTKLPLAFLAGRMLEPGEASAQGGTVGSASLRGAHGSVPREDAGGTALPE